MPKAVYTSFLNKNIPSIIKILNKNFLWKPEVIISAGRFKNLAIQNFPESLHIDSSDLRSANFDYSKFKKKFPVDENILKKLSYYESNFINWIEDSSGRNFSFNERRRFYYELLMYWNTLINNYKPDVLLSFSWPHTVSDYALYLICKHVYSIPVIFLDVIPFFNTKNRLVYLSYDNMSETIQESNNDSGAIPIDPIVEDYLNKLRNKENPFVHSFIFDFFKESKINFMKIFKDLINLAKLFVTLKITEKVEIFFKKNSKPFGKESQMNHLDFFIFKYKTIFKNLKLKKLYKSISEPVDYDQSYIYYPGPYIPEAMSNIVPGKFEDPFLILDMLSSSLPKDWKVYYKEHPATFATGGKGSLGKDKYFYKKLQSYKFVKIVPHDENTFKLTDNSKAVMTAGGTAGWEALVRGKPCLLFGSLWYQNCTEVFKIEKLSDLNKSIEKIKNGFLPDLNNIKKFTQNLYLSLLNNGGLINSKIAEVKKDGEFDKELIILAEDLNKIYVKFYSKFQKND